MRNQVWFASTIQRLGQHPRPCRPLCVVGVCGWCVPVSRVGGYSGGVTPGPIPNPEAKPTCADGTAPGRVWESRSLPANNVCEGVSFVAACPVGLVVAGETPFLFVCGAWFPLIGCVGVSGLSEPDRSS